MSDVNIHSVSTHGEVDLVYDGGSGVSGSMGLWEEFGGLMRVVLR